MLIHFVDAGLLADLPDARGLLPGALALVVWPRMALRIQGRERDVARRLPTVLALQQRLGPVESILVSLRRPGHANAGNR